MERPRYRHILIDLISFAQYDAASRKMVRNRGIAQSGSASALGAECREFESLYADHFPTLLLHRCLQHASVCARVANLDRAAAVSAEGSRSESCQAYQSFG